MDYCHLLVTWGWLCFACQRFFFGCSCGMLGVICHLLVTWVGFTSFANGFFLVGFIFGLVRSTILVDQIFCLHSLSENSCLYVHNNEISFDIGDKVQIEYLPVPVDGTVGRSLGDRVRRIYSYVHS